MLGTTPAKTAPDPWFLEILDSTSDFVAIADADGNVVHINRAGRAIAGVGDKLPLARLHVSDLHTNPIGKKLMADAVPVAVRDGSWAGKGMLRTRDGHDIPVSQVVTAKMDADGRLERLAVVMRDLRAGHSVTPPVALGDAKFRLLVEAMGEGFLVVDADEKVIYANPRAAEILGWAPSDLLDRPVRDFVDATSVELYLRQIAQRRTGESAPYDLTLKGRYDRKVRVRISPSRVLTESGEFAGSFAVISDITRRVQMESALRESQKELRRVSTQLLSIQESERRRIALDLHDGIGQSLSAINYGLEGVLQALDADSIAESARELAAISNKMRDAIAEIRRTAMALRPSTLDDLGILATLSWHFREFENTYRDISVDKDVRLREEEVPERLKTALYRIIQEALNNIAKHANASQARVSLVSSDGHLRLTIEDNGQGFDVGKPNGDNSSAGIGLASMRDRVLLTEGVISIESAPGRGARIFATWRAAGA